MTEIGYFQIPNNWQWIKLNEIGDIVTGKTPSKQSEKNYGNEFPFFKPPDLDEGFFLKESYDNLSSIGTEQVRKIPKKSTLVTCIASIGKIGFLNVQGATNQQINSIIPNSNIIPEFLYFICTSNFFQNILKRRSSSTTVPIINKTSFSKLKIPLPPIEEQNKLSEILTSFEFLIRNLKIKITLLKKVKQGLLQQLLIKGIGHTEFKETKLGRIPKEWEVVKFQKVVEINPKRQVKKGMELKYIAMENVNEIFSNIKNWEIRKYKGSRSCFINDDVLLARITPCAENGKTALVNFLDYNEKAFGSSELIVFKSKKEKILPYYLYYLLKSQKIRDLAISKMHGTTGRQRIPYEFFRNELLIALPLINEQKKIIEILNNIDNIILINLDLYQKRKILMKGLMQQLLIGKIRVKT